MYYMLHYLLSEISNTIDNKTISTLKYYNFNTDDKITTNLILIQKPSIVLMINIMYLLFVLASKYIRPKFKRIPRNERYVIKYLMSFYNIILILISYKILIGIIYETYFKNQYSLWGNEYNAYETNLAYLIYMFYISKYYEYFDTVIMVMNGNMEQVTVLHVYHHSSISCIWWLITYSEPGGDVYFSAMINCFIHMCMYCYYLLSSIIPKESNQLCGKYLTQMQISQFVLNIVQSLYCLRKNNFASISLVYMVSLICLFGNFYYKKHNKIKYE